RRDRRSVDAALSSAGAASNLDLAIGAGGFGCAVAFHAVRGGSVSRLRYLTAGESHGPGLVGILEGLPAGLPLESAEIDRDLARRQRGYGRGGRMKIEQDAAEIVSGVRFGKTL